MSKFIRFDPEKLQKELDAYRSTAVSLYENREANPLIDKQLNFWLESARFFIAELAIWGKLKNEEKCEAALRRAQKALDHVNELLIQLSNEEFDGYGGE